MRCLWKHRIHQTPPTLSPSRLLFKTFYLVWFCLFAVLFGFTVIKYYKYKYIVLPLSVILCAAAFLLFFLARDFINALSAKTVYIILAFISLLMLAALFWAGWIMWVEPFNDTGTCYYAVAEILETGTISKEVNEYTACYWATETSNHDYFLIYPNSTFLVFYQLCYYKLLRIFYPVSLYSSSGQCAVILLNGLSIVFAVIFGFFTARKAKDNCAAFSFLTLAFFFVPFYLHAYKAYSDTLSLPYVTAALYCYVSGTHAKTRKSSMIFYLLSGISLSLGILIKGNIYVLLIAMILYTLLRPEPFRRKLSALLCLILVCLFMLNAWSLYRDNCSWLDTAESDRYKLPTMHWVMMSMSVETRGDYNAGDFEYSQSFPTYAEKKDACTQELIRRVKAYGTAKNFIYFEIDKVSRVLADGLYAQYAHLGHIFSKIPILKEWINEDGKYYPWFYGYITVYITIFYISMLISAVLGMFRKNHPLSTMIDIFLFGTLLFFSFWEFKSRYLMNCVPLYMLCTSFAWSDCADILQHYLSGKSSRKLF